MYYTSDGIGIDTYQGRNILSDAKLNELTHSYSNMQSFFLNSGADFYMMTIPDKEAIYPEYYPDNINKYSDKTRIDLLDEYMIDNSNVNVFNLKQALLDNKGSEMLYFKNYDCTHWNMNGAFIGYTEIMNRIKQNYPELKVYEKDDFDINSVETKGSMVHLSTIKRINDSFHLKDRVDTYYLKDGYRSELKNDIPEGITVEANDKFFHYVNTNNANKPKLFIVGDSYIYSFLLPLFSESFSEVYFSNFTSAQKIMDLQNAINADIVLYEFVERVFNENITTELMNFKGINISDYKSLPVINNEPEFHIDTPQVNSNNTLVIDENAVQQNIYGWTIDIIGETPAGAVYADVGGKVYIPDVVERPDLTVLNQKYLTSGFVFNIPTQELKNTQQIVFHIVSGNYDYLYKPLVYNVEIK